MSQSTVSMDAPASPAPGDPHLAGLAEALRQLAESQRTLLEAIRTGASVPQSADITGDPGDAGVKPAQAVDFSVLSPLQQITVGLRDARPQGEVALRRLNQDRAAQKEEVSSAAD